MVPVHFADFVRAHQFSRRSIWLVSISADFAREAHHLADKLGKFVDRQVLCRANIDMFGVRIALHQEDAGIGTVVGMKELAPRRARAPDRDVVGTGQLRLMRLADQGRQNVAGVQVEIVAGAVQIGRHGADEIAAMLFPVRLGQFDASDLGDRIPFVGGFQRAGQQGALRDRLRGLFRIDAAGAEEQHLANARPIGRLGHIGRDHQVVVKKVGRHRVVGQNAADLCRRHEDGVGPVIGDEGPDGGGVFQIQLGARSGDDLAVLARQPAHNGRAHHPAMTSDPDALAREGEDHRGEGRFTRHCAAVPWRR